MANSEGGDIWQKELWTVQEVAEYLRVSYVTVWRWCQQGVLPSCQVGRSWRIYRDALPKLGEPPLSEHSDPNPRTPSSPGECDIA
jgi:excisionase family DNA binding protein